MAPYPRVFPPATKQDGTQHWQAPSTYVSIPSSTQPASNTHAESQIKTVDGVAPPASEPHFTPSDGGDRPPPHNAPSYTHRGVQTSPQPYYLPDATTYPHQNPCPVVYISPRPVPNPFGLPIPLVYMPHGNVGVLNGAGQGRDRTQPFFAPVFPLGPYPAHTRYPVPDTAPVSRPTPLIAPPPKVPLPSLESLSLGAEPSSQTIPASTSYGTSIGVTPSAVTVSRRPVSTSPPGSADSPIENPVHTLYKSLRSVFLISESDPLFLAREISGEQLINVHGVGVWSFRGTTAATVEAAKQRAFLAHASRDAWLHAARARTAHYATPGAVRPPLRWVLLERGAALPSNALQTGTEASGARLFSARGWWAGGLHLGKAAAHLRSGGASISNGSLEHPLTTFEVLVGDQRYATWFDVPAGVVLAFPPTSSDAFPVGALNAEAASYTRALAPDTVSLPASFMPVEGGREAGGEPLLIAQAAYARGWHPGKARLGDDHCCVAYGGGELWVKKFRVLGYNI